jgi:hypothetical protein
MQIRMFSVGDKEKHTVEISKSWFWGSVAIKVDGQKVKTRHILVGGNKEIDVSVGVSEPHHLNIVVKVPIFAGAFRPWQYEIKVDGQPVPG